MEYLKLCIVAKVESRFHVGQDVSRLFIDSA